MRYNIITLLLIIIAPGIFADDSLTPVINSILDNNPELMASKARMASEISDLRSENTLAGPAAEFNYYIGPADSKWEFSVSQEFEWPGVYSARAKAADAKANAFDLLYQEKRREMGLKVREAILNYIKAKQKIDLLIKIDQNLESLSQAYDKALTQGKATAIEVRKLGIICFNITRSLADTESELKEYAAQLSTMNNGKDVDIPLTSIPIELLRSEQDYIELFTTSDPSIKAAEALSKAARSELTAIKRSSLPGFSIGYLHEYEDNAHLNGVSVGINLPNWSNRHKKNKINQEMQALDFERLDYINSRTAAIKSDYATAKRLNQLLSKGKALFDDTYVNMLDKSMEGGQIDLFTYLSDLNEFLDARTAYLDIQLEYALLLARLNRTI